MQVTDDHRPSVPPLKDDQLCGFRFLVLIKGTLVSKMVLSKGTLSFPVADFIFNWIIFRMRGFFSPQVLKNSRRLTRFGFGLLTEQLSHWLLALFSWEIILFYCQGLMLVLLAVSGLNTKGVLWANLNQQVEIVTRLNQNREKVYGNLLLINSHNLLSGTEVLKSKHFVEFKQSCLIIT